MIKNIKIERRDLFPEQMKISKIKVGKILCWGESTTGFVGDSISCVLSHTYNRNGNWGDATARHLAFTIGNKIEKEEKINIPEDFIFRTIQDRVEKILKKVYKRGVYTFEFEVEDLLVPGGEKIYNKEIKLQKLSTGNILLNEVLILDDFDLIKFVGDLLGVGVKPSYDYEKIQIRFLESQKFIIIDPIMRHSEINIDIIKKLAKEIMLEDVVFEETFTI